MKGEPKGDEAAGGIAAAGDAVGVDVEIGGMVADMLKGAGTIMERLGQGAGLDEAVVAGDDRDALVENGTENAGAQFPFVAEAEAATVKVQEQGARAFTLGLPEIEPVALMVAVGDIGVGRGGVGGGSLGGVAEVGKNGVLVGLPRGGAGGASGERGEGDKGGEQREFHAWKGFMIFPGRASVERGGGLGIGFGHECFGKIADVVGR